MEVEAKFSILNSETYAHLKDTPQLGTYTLANSTRQEMIDTYWDTPDWKILGAGYTCRQRDLSASTLVTIKSLHGQDGPIHRRQELEVTLPAAAPLEQWPTSPAKELITQIVQEKDTLIPLFNLHQDRLTRPIHQGERLVAILSLDQVKLAHHTRDQAYFEVEVELQVAGTEADLKIIIGYLETLPGLDAEGLSKFERGLAFVQTNPRKLPPTPADGNLPATPGITGQNTITEAAYKILHFQLRHMLVHEPGARKGHENEELHRMRVATRRMHSTLQILEEHLDMHALATFFKDLKRTRRALSSIRDMDVFWGKTHLYQDSFPLTERPDLTPLHRAWESDYQLARQKMLAYLDSERYHHFKTQFETFLNAELPKPREQTPPHQVRDQLPRIIYKSWAEIKTYDKWLEQAQVSLKRYHRLRIAIKNLRYTMEFFQEVLGPEIKPALSQLKALQDHLGALQDAVVACERLNNFLTGGHWDKQKKKDTRNPIETVEVHAYLTTREKEIEHLIQTFPETWKHFRDSAFRDLITHAISAL